jgi:predicted molibdopterin-dependent oxidoreductase YjgC
MSEEVTISVDGTSLRCAATVSVAAALLAGGYGPALRRSERGGEPRGLFCGMGVCFDCLVTVDGRTGVRACMTLVRDGMKVELP